MTSALKEIRVIDRVEVPNAEMMADGLEAASDMLDSWATEKLTISGMTISTYSLVTAQQNYTIGSGGNFNQTYPQRIEYWSVIPDDAATLPLERAMGRPYTVEQWQLIPQKSQTGEWPTAMYFDHSFASGLGLLSFYPIPNNSHVDIKLYQYIPAITSLAQATVYVLARGATLAIKLQLALRLAVGYGTGATVSEELKQQATDALAVFKRSNYRPKESKIKGEFLVGHDDVGHYPIKLGIE